MALKRGPKPKRHPGGRPTDYKPEYAKEAHKLCNLGATVFELADFFEVTIRTIYRWRLQHPEFCHSLKTGKDALDERVEDSLFHRAMGYKHDAVKIFLDKNGNTVYAPFVEHVPPDPTSMIFWLKNRQPERWRDRRTEDGNSSATTVIIGGITDADRIEAVRQLLSKDRK